jgi:SH3-like domain-containing protein
MIQLVFGKTVRLAVVLLAGAVGLGAAPAPQFASISRDKAFLREGPSYQHRILWVYHRKDWPVEIVQTFDVWRKVRDKDGTTGWMHSSMVSDRRTVVVTSQSPAKIMDGVGERAKLVAKAQPGVVARLEACKPDACEVNADGTEGWIDKKDIWGVGASEVFK